MQSEKKSCMAFIIHSKRCKECLQSFLTPIKNQNRNECKLWEFWIGSLVGWKSVKDLRVTAVSSSALSSCEVIVVLRVSQRRSGFLSGFLCSAWTGREMSLAFLISAGGRWCWAEQLSHGCQTLAWGPNLAFYLVLEANAKYQLELLSYHYYTTYLLQIPECSHNILVVQSGQDTHFKRQ